MTTETVEAVEVISTDLSGHGFNAYYHHCDAVQHSTPYCACVNKMKAFSENRLGQVFSECGTALLAHKCPAVKMRREELEAGKAIYFVSRMKITQSNQQRDAEAQAKMALTAEKEVKKSKHKAGNHAVYETSTVSTEVPSSYGQAPKKVKPEVKEEAVDFSSAMAKVLSDEIAKANSAPKESPEPVVKAAVEVKQVPAPSAKKSMVEIALEMREKRKLEAQA